MTITLESWQDCISPAIFLALLCWAVGSFTYFCGRRHSYWIGYHAGREETECEMVPRILEARHDGIRVGRIKRLSHFNN